MIKSYVLQTLAALALLVPAAQAQANKAPIGTCAFKAVLTVQSLHFIVGGTQGVGTGWIVCEYSNGYVEKLPVKVTTRGVGFGLGASQTRVTILAAGIGAVQGGARSLAGKYAIAQAGGQFVNIGGEVGLGMTANRNGIAMPIGIQAKTGEGLEIAMNFGGMMIEALR